MAIAGGFSILGMLTAITAAVVAYLPYVAAALAVGAVAYAAVQSIGGISAVRDMLIDWICSGEAALSTAAILMLVQVAVVAKAIDDAIAQAVQAARGALQQLRKLPMFPVIRSLMPTIFGFDVGALLANPAWFVLNYNGVAGWATTTANRLWVKGRWGFLMATAPAGYQLDEFPYACTAQGGPPAALGMPVPGLENSLQGGFLGAFTLTP